MVFLGRAESVCFCCIVYQVCIHILCRSRGYLHVHRIYAAGVSFKVHIGNERSDDQMGYLRVNGRASAKQGALDTQAYQQDPSFSSQLSTRC